MIAGCRFDTSGFNVVNQPAGPTDFSSLCISVMKYVVLVFYLLD